MRAINHALTGAIIGLGIPSDVAAIVLSIGSHYVLDAIPHFDMPDKDKKFLKSRAFKISLAVDAGLCLVLVLALAIVKPYNWFIACVCAFLAAAPDFFNLSLYRAVKEGKDWKPGLYNRFAGKIQWFQRPAGIVVELVWLVMASYVLAVVI